LSLLNDGQNKVTCEKKTFEMIGWKKIIEGFDFATRGRFISRGGIVF